jgi:hypothetical protein
MMGINVRNTDVAFAYNPTLARQLPLCEQDKAKPVPLVRSKLWASQWRLTLAHSMMHMNNTLLKRTASSTSKMQSTCII